MINYDAIGTSKRYRLPGNGRNQFMITAATGRKYRRKVTIAIPISQTNTGDDCDAVGTSKRYGLPGNRRNQFMTAAATGRKYRREVTIVTPALKRSRTGYKCL